MRKTPERLRAAATWLMAGLLLAFLAAPTRAQEMPPFRAGQRGFAELSVDGSIEIPLHGNAGDLLTLTVKAFRGSGLLPALALRAPDGSDVPVAGNLTTNAKGSKVKLKKLALTTTGTYRIIVSATGGTSGGFDLLTKFRAADKLKLSEVLAGVPLSLPFTARQGDRVKLKPKPDPRTPLVVRVDTLTEADGLVRNVSVLGKTPFFTLGSDGRHTFEVSDPSGNQGAFAYVVKLKFFKPPRKWVDLDAFIPKGSISGRVLVGGQDSSPAAKATAGKAGARRRRTRVRSGELVVHADGERSVAELGAALEKAVPGTRITHKRSLSRNGPHLFEVRGLVGRRTRRDELRTRAILAAARLGAATTIEWVEANGVMHPSREPNDARYGEQYDMRDLQLPAAWDLTIGSPGVPVAVIDSGIWPEHPDFEGRLLPGFDFVGDASNARDGDGYDSDPRDDAFCFHGTHVAGTVGAAGNDRSGVTGVAWNSRIVPVRALGAQGGSFFDIAAAVRWSAGLDVPGVPANANPVRVINMSLGGSSDARSLRDAIAAAIAEGVTIVAAAGNDASARASFPAAYPGVISVAAVGPDLRDASYSNFGNSISVAAPGGDQSRGMRGILSTWIDTRTLRPTHREIQGTSMASPHVAGIVALLLDVNPSLTPAEVKSTLERTARDLGEPGFDIFFGHGLVDAGAAVRDALGAAAPPPTVVATPGEVVFSPFEADATLRLENGGGGTVTIDSSELMTSDGAAWLSGVTSSFTLPADITLSVDRGLVPTPLGKGTVRLTTSAGAIDIPVRVPAPDARDPGTVTVIAVSPDETVAASTTTDAASGFAYTLGDLPPGNYMLRAFVDRDGNGVLELVDEWFGEFPLLSQPADVTIDDDGGDLTGADFLLHRLDSLFSFAGAGGGSIDGAVAVRVLDASTREPVPGARVHLGNGDQTTVTADDGRALITGGFTGAQIVTVSASGYEPQSHVQSDAQFQGFTLTPLEPETRSVDVTVTDIQPGDTFLIAQAGPVFDVAELDGSASTLGGEFEVPAGRPELPVWALVYDEFDEPVAIDLDTVDTRDPAAVLSATLSPFEPDDNIWVLEAQEVALPTEGLDPLTAFTTAEVSLHYEADQGLLIGLDVLDPLVPTDLRWVSFGQSDPEFAASIEIRAEDDDGSVSSVLFTGTVDTVSTDVVVSLPNPGFPTSPADGTTTTSLTPTLTFTPMPGAELTTINVFDQTTGSVWKLRLPAGATSVTLPAPPGAGLVRGRDYLWWVDGFDVPGFDLDDHRDRDLLLGVRAETSGRAGSFSVR